MCQQQTTCKCKIEFVDSSLNPDLQRAAIDLLRIRSADRLHTVYWRKREFYTEGGLPQGPLMYRKNLRKTALPVMPTLAGAIIPAACRHELPVLVPFYVSSAFS